MDIEPYRSFMIELAEKSGDFIRPYFASHDVKVDLKADETPVTVADRGGEELLRDRIHRRYPAHGIIGEEYGSEKEDAEFVWVLDPVDGTLAFTTAVPLFGTLIALLHNGEPVLGCINQPVLNQMLIGDNEETTLNGRRVRVRQTARFSEATLLVTDTLAVAQYQNGAAFDALAQQCRLVRTWGDCYGYFLLATGWADIACDPIMNPWDIAALIPVVRGSGGVITDWQGGEPLNAKSTLAATPELHARVIRALNP
jgi:histidinol phosphatase-like enzyme (inositol monophosphatase family)